MSPTLSALSPIYLLAQCPHHRCAVTQSHSVRIQRKAELPGEWKNSSYSQANCPTFLCSISWGSGARSWWRQTPHQQCRWRDPPCRWPQQGGRRCCPQRPAPWGSRSAPALTCWGQRDRVSTAVSGASLGQGEGKQNWNPWGQALRGAVLTAAPNPK